MQVCSDVIVTILTAVSVILKEETASSTKVFILLFYDAIFSVQTTWQSNVVIFEVSPMTTVDCVVL
jgi:hypothetical protein